MLRIFAALSLIFCIALPAGAQNTSDARGIEGVIASQIDAFRADDFDRAFTYASPSIQGMFGTAERFGQMVRQGYPMVYRPDELRFVEQVEDGGAVRQKVMIRDMQGGFHMLEYEMTERDGAWRINGVRVLEAAQVGV
ncbi:uncharacterized protein DUF4864 [Palleronia aestuarii]|uniref:Uncharacterized protein DUF4864 n=1 Tax=Palleronia aestuarii TaxID=568105 RepID=A0A2W7NEP4_9RHOB|nr:DUF4864 domain-containing protein [Palleronia aestuarii]PZX15194.1 uncharacterized protein DUF4864 [Palleronia aestuarii]